MLLDVSHVERAFGGIKAVDDVSLTAKQGEIVGIIGANGAGKTTLCSLITGTIRPDTGRIELDGKSIVGMKPFEICRMGLTKTFQITRPFAGLTSTQNVMVPLLVRGFPANDADAEAARILERVGLGHRLQAPADRLSTGQRKRLEFARAIATGARLILLDEPFGGVDQRGIPALIEVILRLRADGVGLMVVEHNIRVVREVSDRVIALHLGRKIADGGPAEVLSAPHVIAARMGTATLHHPDVSAPISR